MRNEQVNARRTNYKQHKNGKGVFEPTHDTLEAGSPSPLGVPDEPFPYLEDAMVIARKYPYSALGVMIGIATIIVAALVTVAVSVFTGMFLMYGTMRETTANQIQIQQSLVVIQKQQTDDMNAVRAYSSNNARRTEFIVAMLSPEGQRRISEWDKSNPQPELPGTR